MNRFAVAATILVVTLGVGTFLVFQALAGSDTAAGDTTTTTVAGNTTLIEGPATLLGTTSPSPVATSTTTTVSTTTTTVPTTTTASTTTTVTTAPTTTVPTPGFSASISTVTAADLPHSWREGCPVGPDELRAVSVTHWNSSGGVSTGEIVVATSLASDVVDIFRDLYEAEFPIERMVPVDQYGGDDDASMAANNTSAFNCRLVTGGSSFSEHSYGRAIDLNPLVNPYVKGSTVLPPAGAPYVDRNQDVPGMIHAGDEVVDAFAAHGWIWGGTWSSLKDYQHFSTTGA